jgi:hypothetical protein
LVSCRGKIKRTGEEKREEEDYNKNHFSKYWIWMSGKERIDKKKVQQKVGKSRKTCSKKSGGKRIFL